MKKFIAILVLGLLLSGNAYAGKYNPYKVGDIIENEVVFGKRDKFPLPPGKFTVGVIHKKQKFNDIMLYQEDENGVVRWAVQVMGTGSTQWESWKAPKWCKRTNVYFIKKKIGNKTYACWMVNHSRSDIGANKGFWKEVRDYEIANRKKTPDIFVYSLNTYAKRSKLYEWSYYYNPELDGVPKPKSLEWDTNEFHMQRVMNYPKHEAFLKKFISISAELRDRFNQLNKVKGKTSLDASTYITQASINTGSGSENKNVTTGSSKNITQQIKELNELYESGVLTKEEFEKAKKKLLN